MKLIVNAAGKRGEYVFIVYLSWCQMPTACLHRVGSFKFYICKVCTIYVWNNVMIIIDLVNRLSHAFTKQMNIIFLHCYGGILTERHERK